MRSSPAPALDHRGWEWPAVVALAVAALYLGVIWRQDGEIEGFSLIVFAAIAAPGVLGLIGSRTSDADRALHLRSVSAGALLSMGVLGIFSIGLPLLIAGIGFVVAAARGGRAATPKARSRAFGWGLAGAAVPWVVLLV
jgi:hypothetical protein